MADVRLKVYHSGKLAGKYVVYFDSIKARDLFKSLCLDLNGATHIMSGKLEDVPKVRSFLTGRDLTFAETTIN